MKHPLLENRTRFFVWWLAWLILAAGQSLVIHFGYGIPADTAFADGVISMIFFRHPGTGCMVSFKVPPEGG